LADESLSQRKKLEEDNKECKSSIKSLRDQIKHSQSEFNDEIAKITKEKGDLENENAMFKERYAMKIEK